MPSFKLLLTIFMLFSLYIQTGLAEMANPTPTSVVPADNNIGAPGPLYPINAETPRDNDNEVSVDDAVNDDTVDDDGDLDVSSDPTDPDTLFGDDKKRKMCRGKCRRVGDDKVCHCTRGGFATCRCHIANGPCRCIVH